MKNLKELFGSDKPIVALLHLQALPGDVGYKKEDRMEHVIEQARKDLAALQNGGVDGILFSNEYSLPYQSKVDTVVVAAMARIISELRSEINVPFGVHVISDPASTIELAAALDAQFVRSIFTGVYAGESGLRTTDIAKILRRKNELNMQGLMMFYMIGAESDGDVSRRSVEDIAQALIFKCQPDAFCVSGKSAGREADAETLASVRKVANGLPVLYNTGVSFENVIEKLENSDGAFVGTSFKRNGKFENPVDPERVVQFMDRVREYRNK